MVVAMLAVAAVAIAKSFTLNVAKNATVTNMTTMVTKHETIAVNGKGFAVYWLTGDSKSHPKCTKANGCFSVLAAGDGRVGQGAQQGAGDQRQAHELEAQRVHPGRARRAPLYTFAPDTKKHDATGEGIVGFGGTWHALTVSAAAVERPGRAAEQPEPSPMPNPYPQGY